MDFLNYVTQFLRILTSMSMVSDTDLVLKNSSDKFTSRMFHEVVQLNPGRSVIISAFSVMPALAQLALASESLSHDELMSAIGLSSHDDVKEVFSGVNRQLKAVKGITLQIANRIYVAKHAAINKNFAEMSREIFNSDVKNVDFSKSQQSAHDINTWVEHHTNHKIKNLVKPKDLDDSTRSVLVNAIYFKGAWLNSFKTRATNVKDFHVSKTKTVKVPTMYTMNNFTYGESAELNAKLLEMPYEDNEASFLVVLPNKIGGLAHLEEKLRDPSLLNKAVGEMRQHEVEVMLPKFRIETETDLEKVLKRMKVRKLFSPSEAMLNNLLEGESGLFISKAVQKAFIEVNEDGSEAAALNVFISTMTAYIPNKKFKIFEANHPFLFYVKWGDTILFNGLYEA